MCFGAQFLAADNIIGALLHGAESDPRQVAVMGSLSYAVLIIPILEYTAWIFPRLCRYDASSYVSIC